MSLGNPVLWSLASFSVLSVAGLMGASILRRRPGQAHVVLVTAIGCSLASGLLPMLNTETAGQLPTETTDPNPPWQALAGRPLDIAIRDFANVTHPDNESRSLAEMNRVSAPSVGFVCLVLWMCLSSIVILTRMSGLFASIRLLRSVQDVDDHKALSCLNQIRTELKIHRDVQFRVSSLVSCPLICCWGRPTIIVPDEFLQQSTSQWRTTFLHELMHLRRRDHWWELIAGLQASVLPWHPCVWICRRWIHRLSEQACDEQVLAAGTSPDKYAETLLHFSHHRRPVLMNPMTSRNNETITRIERILKWDRAEPRQASVFHLVTMLLVLTCLTVSAPFVRKAIAADESAILSPADRDAWIERLTSAPENSRWFVGANLGRELSTLPGRQNVEILTSCWDDIADSVRPQILKGLMPAFKKTDGISDGLFEILNLAWNNSNATIHDFATSYVNQLTFSIDAANRQEYTAWFKSVQEQTATDIVADETTTFVAGLPKLSRSQVPAAIDQLADSSHSMRELSAMRQAAVDGGLLITIDKWINDGGAQATDQSIVQLKQNLAMAGASEVEPKPLATSDEDDEFAGYPVEELTLDRRKRQRCFLMGPARDQNAPVGGWKLLLILPGGDGSAEFNPFCRRIHKNALPDGYVAVQLVAPVWSTNQNRVVWPSRKLNPDKATFTTEKFVAAVAKEIKTRIPIDERYVFTLGWSSGGPPLYAAALERRPVVTGSMIAMSIFKPSLLPTLKRAKDRSFYLLHSPDDFIRMDQHARVAERLLKKAGANVKLQTYGGGHGWREDPFGHIRRGIAWLEDHVASE